MRLTHFEFTALLFFIVFLAVLVLVVLLVVWLVRSYFAPNTAAPAQAGSPASGKSLAQTLKDHRTRCKLTQEYVAGALGVPSQMVSKWETGESEPTMSNLSALAKTYGVTLAQLLQDVG